MRDLSPLTGSLFYKAVRKTALFLTEFTLASMRKTGKYLDNFKSMRAVGVTFISAILVNLSIVYVMGKELSQPWLLYRCLIVITLIPWILCDRDLKEVARDSKILGILFKK